MTYRYTVLLERGHSEDVWVATVPTLPGCATQGGSAEHVEALVALGEPVPTESEPTIVATVAIDVDPTASMPLPVSAD